MAAPDVDAPSNSPDSTLRTPSDDLVADFDKVRPQESEIDAIVEAIVNRQPIDNRLFLIGPAPASEQAGKSGDPAKRHQATDGEPSHERATTAAAETEAEETVLEDNWVQMDLDEDGTYLFVGEDAEDDEALNDDEMLDLDNIGVGIGKKWHF